MADCGPINPLQSLLKHSERDASVQHDRFTQIPGPSGTASNGSFRNGGAPPAQQQQQHPGGFGHGFSQADLDREMQQFGFGGGKVDGPVGAEGAFAMEAMKRELAQFNAGNGIAGGQTRPVFAGNPDWANQFQANGKGGASPTPQQAEAWRRSYLSSPATSASVQQQQPSQPTAYAPSPLRNGAGFMPQMQMPFNQFQASPMMAPGGGVGAMPYMQQQYRQAPAPVGTADQKGKGRIVELDDKAWEAEFAKLGSNGGGAAATTAETAQMPSSFQEPTDLASEDQAAVAEAEDETDDAFMRNIERTWRNLKDTLDTSNLDDRELAAWEAQYGTNFNDLHDGGEFDYDGGAEEAVPGFDPASFDEWLTRATSKPYPFVEESDNPYMSSFDPFAEGQRLLTSGAPLSEAALAFEAACRQNEHRSEAWKALGDTLAADEKELKAIKALERAVACQDGSGGGEAWMSLAISYVNEGQDLRAFSTLEKWVRTTYPETCNALPPQSTDNAANPWAISARLVDMFLAAANAGPRARQSPTPGGSEASAPGVRDLPVDPDVQSGLGVLFYTSSDYGRARDCFEAALSVRPDDFLLWNRLGATLANGGQPEDAIEAYRKALELRPTFTRAIYNLGVSCLNISCFHEASEHMLAALDLQRKDKLVAGNKGKGKGSGSAAAADEAMDDGSENLWNTLRRAFMCLERPDLADRARPGADIDSFRKDGFAF